jgi:hypothetical protein
VAGVGLPSTDSRRRSHARSIVWGRPSRDLVPRTVHIASLMPRRINHTLAGQDVAKPSSMPICINSLCAGAVGIRMRAGEEHKAHQRHPAEQADLERTERGDVGFRRGQESSLAQPRAAHAEEMNSAMTSPR